MINKRKYQLGGAMPQGGGIMEKIAQLPLEQQQLIMQAFAQWAQQKGIDVNQIQNNPQALEQAMTAFIQEMQQGQQAQAAKQGAKLQYIKDLKGTCPEGTHLEYYKAGGRLCKKCMKNQDGGEMEQEKKGGVLSQYKEKVKKDCGGAKMKACGGAKMKKHQIGGTIETLRASLGLERKNLIKAQQGAKVEPQNKWVFSRRTSNLGNGYQVLSDWIYQSRVNGEWMGDLAPTVAGRTIYASPHGNDTVFWRKDDRHIWSNGEGQNGGGGIMPVPERSRNQLAAKANFYRWVPRTTAETNSSVAPRNRALRGN